MRRYTTACDVGSDWAGYDFSCTINNPVTEALMVGADPLSSKSGNALTVATVSLEVVSEFKAGPSAAFDCLRLVVHCTVYSSIVCTKEPLPPLPGALPPRDLHKYRMFARSAPVRDRP